MRNPWPWDFVFKPWCANPWDGPAVPLDPPGPGSYSTPDRSTRPLLDLRDPYSIYSTPTLLDPYSIPVPWYRKFIRSIILLDPGLRLSTFLHSTQITPCTLTAPIYRSVERLGGPILIPPSSNRSFGMAVRQRFPDRALDERGLGLPTNCNHHLERNDDASLSLFNVTLTPP